MPSLAVVRDSYFVLSRRYWPSHAKVRSTMQSLEGTLNPLSARRMIARSHRRTPPLTEPDRQYSRYWPR